MSYIFKCDMCRRFHPDVKHAATVRFEHVFSLKADSEHFQRTIEVCGQCIGTLHNEVLLLYSRLELDENNG